MICKKCGFENSSISTHCINCGARLDGKVICPNCGESYPEGTPGCKRCGTPLTNKPTELSKFGKAIVKVDKKVRPIIKIISMTMTWIVVGLLFLPIVSFRHPALHGDNKVFFNIIDLFIMCLNGTIAPSVSGVGITCFILTLIYASSILITAIFSTIFGLKYFKNERFGMLRFIVADLVATLVYNTFFINLVNYGLVDDYLVPTIFAYVIIFGVGSFTLLLVSINIFKSFNKNDVLLFKVKIVFAVSFIACYLSLYFSIFGMYFISGNPVNIFRGFGTDLVDSLLFFKEITSATDTKEIALNALNLFNFGAYFLSVMVFGSLLVYSSIFFENNKEETAVFRYPHFYLSAVGITLSSINLFLSIIRVCFATDGGLLSSLGILSIVFAIIHFALAIIAFKLGNKHKRLRRAINNIAIKTE